MARGEAVERWPGARLDNQYGPTETTIYATVARVLADEPVKIVLLSRVCRRSSLITG